MELGQLVRHEYLEVEPSEEDVELTHEDVVRLWLMPRLKEVEEQLLAVRVYIEIAGERSGSVGRQCRPSPTE